MNDFELFQSALDIEDPAARKSFLQSACQHDAGLLSRVEALLASHEGASLFLQTPVGEQLASGPSGTADTVFIGSGSTHNEPASFDLKAAAMAEQDDSEDGDEEVPLGYLQPSTRADSLGRLAHYEILEVVGRGAFGTVLRAFDEKLQRVVAIKVMALELASTSPARKRFIREAQASAAIRHEHVVSVYAVEEKPIPYLVMEYIPGQTLQQKLRETGPLDVSTVLRLGRQIAEGLAAAHAKDLIHRDIKPGNILLEAGLRERVKITDFGLARAADDASMTQSGVIAGTPMYMAPEQALGNKLDQRADLFSLGSVLYQMVSGRPPFRASSTLAVLKRLTEEPARPIQEIIPEAPAWLCAIIAKLHAKNPDERYQSAQEVVDVLANCESQIRATSKLQDFSRIPQNRSTPRRSFRITWAAAAAALLMMLFATFWFGPTALLYLTNRGELWLMPEDGLNSVIVLQNDEGDLVTDKLRTPITDWLDLNEKTQNLKLPPGRYQLNVRTSQAGTSVSQWSISNSGPFGSDKMTVPVINSSAIVSVQRGHRVTLQPVIRKPNGTPVAVSPVTEDGWTQLFNGKDLTGWKTHPEQPGTWNVRDDGVLIGSSLQSHLFTERADFANFHLRAEVKINRGGDGGIRFRVPFKLLRGKEAWQVIPAGGYEAEFTKFRHASAETGSVWRVNQAAPPNTLFRSVDEAATQPDAWHLYEVIADGNHFITKLDGRIVADCTDADKLYSQGRIALQCFSPQTRVEFRKIEIKELPANSPQFAIDFNGNWNSAWGPVTFTHPPGAGDQQFKLVGTYYRGSAGIKGTVDPKTRTMLGTFDEGVRRGKIRLVLSEDGNHITGHYGYQSATRDDALTTFTWDLTRQGVAPPATAPPQAIAPFDATQAKAHQEAWAKHLGVPVEYTNSIGMKFMLIPPGEFTMGSTAEEIAAAIKDVTEWAHDDIRSEAPARKVRISEPFYLGTTEVTVGQFRQFVAATGYKTHAETNGKGGAAWTGNASEFRPEFTWRHHDLTLSDSHPVGQLCAADATAFCIWLESIDGCRCQLPKEEQWEYACRAGTVTPWSFGSDVETKKKHGVEGWDLGFTGRAVAQMPANPFGLFDVHGNFMEICRTKDGAFAARGGISGNDSVMARSATRHGSLDRFNSWSLHSFRVSIAGNLPKQLPPAPAIALFDATQAKQHQEAWAKHLGVPVEYTNSIGMKFRLIPPGEFLMGASDEEIERALVNVTQSWQVDRTKAEGPQRSMTIREPYYLGQFEVTLGQFRQFVQETGYKTTADTNGKGGERHSPSGEIEVSPDYLWSNPIDSETDDHPVVFMSIEDARQFCSWLTGKDGRRYAVPRDDQWEFACRAGTTTWWFDEKDVQRIAWTRENSESRLHPIGQKAANPFGLCDMHGNAAELCEAALPKKVARRGGQSTSIAISCRSASRWEVRDALPWYRQGFRVAIVGELKPAGSIAKQEPLPPMFTNTLGMEFVKVPKGKSWLGGGKDKLGDKEVEIADDFYLSKFEVTQEEWEKVMGANPSYFSRTGGGKGTVQDIADADLKRFPVEWVSWEDCQMFVGKLNKLENDGGWVYRLPKIAEWEYACRGGPMADKLDSAFDFYFAKPTNTLLPEQANFDDSALKRTCKVGSYKPNTLGLFDIHGNVAEWCENTYSPTRNLMHGGCWYDDASKSVAKFFGVAARSSRMKLMGLRLARVPVGAPSPDAKSPPSTLTPFTDADAKRIAALPAEEQVAEVKKELIRRNPGFDGKLETKIEADIVAELRINTEKVTDISPIRAFPSLRVLDCSGTDSRPGQLADLTPLAGMNLAGLTDLRLAGTRVDDAGLSCFQGCTNLKVLFLGYTRVTDAGLAHFQNCKNLTVLDLGSTAVTDAGLLQFKGCQELVTLYLFETQVSDAGLANFRNCTNLSQLALGDTKVSDTGLAHFKDCQSLTFLDLRDTNVTDTGLAYFEERKGLERLRVNATGITDAGLARFKDCKSLTQLHLSQTKVSDAGLAGFKGAPLTELWINETDITDLTPLEGMPLKDIRLTPKNITKGLDMLRAMKSIETIGINVLNSWPAAEFWQRYDKGEFDKAAASFNDADVKRNAALPAQEQGTKTVGTVRHGTH